MTINNVKCVILGLNDTCFYRTVEERKQLEEEGVIGLLYGMFSM